MAAKDSSISRTLVVSVDSEVRVSEDQGCKADSRLQMQMRYLERHLEAEILSKISLEMMMISSMVGDSLDNLKLNPKSSRDKEALA